MSGGGTGARVELRAERAGALADVLAAQLAGLDRARAIALVTAGGVFVEGKRARDPALPIAAGARLVVHRLGGASSVPAAQPLKVLFEDEDIVVLDKAPGDHLNETETSAVAAVVERIEGAFVVHRLDRETSGAVVLAKSARVAERLSAAFRERRVQKRYLALTEGALADGALTDPIGPDKRRPRARRVRADGQSAHTDVRTVGRLEATTGRALLRGAAGVGPILSAIEAVPHTGRTHQIRVHLAHHGAPLLGDRLYGGPMVVRIAGAVVEVARVMLHARLLVLPGWPAFEAPIPADMRAFAARGLTLS